MTNRRPFEQVRAELHHDKLKNEYLTAMGYYPTDVGNEVRRRVMTAAISGDDSNWKRLERGCEIWARIAPEILDFISTLQERYGYVLTKAYRRECEKTEKAIKAINKIENKIRGKSLKESDIDIYWAAADTVRLLLQDLAKTRRFSEFVLDVDSSLITE